MSSIWRSSGKRLKPLHQTMKNHHVSWENSGKRTNTYGKSVFFHITMKNQHAIDGKNQYFDGHFQ